MSASVSKIVALIELYLFVLSEGHLKNFVSPKSKLTEGGKGVGILQKHCKANE